ncbi:MAG TPA: DUF1800 family protein, partial [Gemmatimonadaceae bacterium]
MRITKLVASMATLLVVAPLGASAQTSAARKATVASDVRELPADQQIIQALSRLTFGPRPGDVLKVRAIGVDKWIDQQLHPDKIDDHANEQFVASYGILHQDQNDLLKQYAEEQRAKREVKRDKAAATDAADSMAVRKERQQQLNG